MRHHPRARLLTTLPFTLLLSAPVGAQPPVGGDVPPVAAPAETPPAGPAPAEAPPPPIADQPPAPRSGPPELVPPGTPEEGVPLADLSAVGIESEFGMTLEELLSLDTTVASITNTSALASPASITTITEEDIRLTPARNLLDLLEVYVPGALWMVHSEGPHPGFRGIISDRNNKFLLLVNGRLLNQKAHGGAVTELENWDLSDIAEIHVLRGPGSVTYGPGAIAGVISITTKSGERTQRTSVRVRTIMPYDSRGVAVDTSVTKDKLAAYFHASLVSTQGVAMRTFQVDNMGRAGYLSEEFTDQSPLHYRDFDGRPQLKAHLDLRYGSEWNLWARYTQSGATAGAALAVVTTADRFVTGFLPNGGAQFGPPETFRQLSSRQFTAALNNDHAFGKAARLKTSVSYYSLDWRRRLATPLVFLPTDPPELRNALVDRDHVRYYRQRFAEDEVAAQTLLNLDFGEPLQIALGGGWTYNKWGPGWGDDVRQFRMGDASNIISGTDSQAYGASNYRGVDPNQLWIRTTGFGSSTISAVGEAKLKLHPMFGLLVSGRVDKNDLSPWLVTPRVVVTSEMSKDTALRLIWQRAQRMNTAEQLYFEKKVTGGLAEPEALTGYEAILTTLVSKYVSVSVAGFYNQLGVIGFNTTRFDSPVVGDLKLAGGEAELAVSTSNWRGGLNHSFVKQLSWQLREGITQSGISYSDYGASVTLNPMTPMEEKFVIRGRGNDLNNWVNHATKVFVNYRPVARVTFHLDARVLWAYEGAWQGIEALGAAVASTSGRDNFVAARARLNREDVYGMDARVNASVTMSFGARMSLSLYGMNLVGIGGFKRYSYDAGNVQAVPGRTQYLQEPLTVGGLMEYTF